MSARSDVETYPPGPPGTPGTAPAARAPGRGRVALGRYGERVAARWLADAGMTVLERNWRCRDGEIDIVARDGDAIVICEVKTRSAGPARDYQHPLAGVDEAKTERLRHLAERWLAERWLDGHGGRPPAGGVRIDVIGVIRRRRGAAQVEHVRGVL